ncbi:hypothetical protein OG763_39980 [Streptomyces sp. NBC_01230]|nr:hypothetical protein OG763_39980 [Streptomyces sp. NBC_01230]
MLPLHGSGSESARTVQRRVQRLTVRAGASTRIRLGRYTRRHGWA